jgi:hypothetical protein
MLQYLVVLAGTDPLVWRRIHVPATYTFWDLHVAIQDAVGWLDCHLHEFRVVDPRSGTTMRLGIPDPDGFDERSVTADWTESPLDYVMGDPPPMQYTYDFGDNWQHAVIFEDYVQTNPRRKKPKCIGGAGAGPPEDSGGPHQYAELLVALADPEHAEHDDMVEWIGRPFDPAAFSVTDVRFDDPKKRWALAFEGGAI